MSAYATWLQDVEGGMVNLECVQRIYADVRTDVAPENAWCVVAEFQHGRHTVMLAVDFETHKQATAWIDDKLAALRWR